MEQTQPIESITINENAPGPRALFSIQLKDKLFEVDCPKDITALNLINNIKEKMPDNKENVTPITINNVTILDENDISVKYKEQLKIDEDLPIFPNYAERFSSDGSEKYSARKIQLKCNYINENLTRKTKILKIIILNDINIENLHKIMKTTII